MSARRLVALVLTALLTVSMDVAAQQAAANVLTVAAAADLQPALPDLVAAFERKSRKRVRISFGSSGSLFAQIQNGAPFDVFLSADTEYPRRLEAAGLTQADSLSVYAIGHVVVWTPKGSALDLERRGLKALTAPEAKRIALANPAHAPYGRAAEAALKGSGMYEQVKSKLVLGDNVAQAANFVRTRNAQAGFLALSMAQSQRLQIEGQYWLVPQELYPRMEQAGVVLKSSKKTAIAEEFMQFLLSPAGGDILKSFGFTLPGSKPRSKQDKP